MLNFPRTVHRRIALLGAVTILAVWMVPHVALAQPNPSNMRSGVVVATGSTTATAFTVPVGQYFVLTDLDWNPSTFGQTGDFIATISVLDSAVRWSRPATIGGGLMLLPSLHNTTGIVFNPGMTFYVATNSTIPPSLNWNASWSGYLASGLTGAVESETEAGRGLALHAAPNPAKGDASLSLTLTGGGSVALAVYSVDGACVRTLHSGPLEKGDHVFTWDGRDDAGRIAPEGIYLAKLQSGQGERATRITLLR